MTARFWVEFVLNSLTAWYLTYLIYGMVVFGTVALVVRFGRTGVQTENLLWRLAVLAAPVLATARIGIEHLSVEPIPAGPEVMTVAGPIGWTFIGISIVAVAITLRLTTRLGRLAWRERAVLARREALEAADHERLRGLIASELRTPTPRFTESDRISAPVAIGRREICVPRGVLRDLPDDAVRAVLVHELVHLRRGDSHWATLLHVLNCVFFMQPLQTFASRRIRETSEFVADGYAVRRTGGPEPLVAALTTFARASRGGVAVSGFAPGSLLLRRVERVLSRTIANDRARLPIGIAFLGMALLAAWFAPAVVPACDCLLRAF